MVGWIAGRRRIEVWICVVALLIGIADAWAARHQINPDGISYLDVGNAVFAHGFKAGASSVWSPAYTWIIGGVLKLADPSRPHELIVVMVVNLVIAGVVLAAFTWWLREQFALLRERGMELPVSEPVLRVLGYCVVAWTILREITVTFVTPDLLLGAVAFAATATLVRIARRGGSPPAWLGLGLLLGAGYLVKAGFVLPAIVGCLVCAVLTAGGTARRLGALALTVVAAVAIAAPFVIALSSKEGHLEVGSYGTVNYAWDVDGVTNYLNWTGGDGAFGRPVHPTLIASAPETFAYPSPIGGSIPVWYDPAYWYKGVQPRLVLGRQIHTLARSVWETVRPVLVGPLLLLLVPLLILWRGGRADRAERRSSHGQAASGRLRASPRAVAATVKAHAYLALPVAGIVTYLPLVTQSRYVSEYVAVLVICGFALVGSWLVRRGAPKAMVARAAAATVAVAAITFVYAAIKPLHAVEWQLTGDDAPGTSDLRVARALDRAGIRPGAGVAVVGDSTTVLGAYWARLDRVRVVGNVNDLGGALWHMTATARMRRLRLLAARTGARTVVSDEPGARSSPGWVPIPGTGDSYLRL